MAWKKTILFANPGPRGGMVSGLLGVLMAPFVIAAGVVVLVLSLPVMIAVFFWSRYKLKKFFRALREESQQQGRYVDSYTVETVDENEPPKRELTDGHGEDISN